jgi:glycosyltransferase involved in cell wall biosynthesis/peptidoglycan/xylan/chitin deacetylase (PgdA/CDA1 family)
MTVMFIIDVLGEMGGAERNLCQVARGLRGRGHEVIVLALRGGKLSNQLRNEGFTVEEINTTRVYGLRGVRTLLRMAGLTRQRNVSVLISYHESSDLLGILLSALARIPIISSRRDMGFKLKARHIWFYRLFNRFFDRIATVSQAVKDVVVKNQWALPGSVLVIPNGVDMSLGTGKSTCDMTVGTSGDRPVQIFCLANIRPIKGQKVLVEAAALVKKRFPNVGVSLIGEKDLEKAYLEEVRKRIRDLGLDGTVRLTGKIPFSELQPLLGEMDISVLPSLSEGMSNALLESMSMGKPVVATAVGGNPELVEDGKTGYLVPPDDPESLAEALKKLVGSPELRRAMGERGKERAEALYGVPRMVDRYEDLMKAVVLRRKTTRGHSEHFRAQHLKRHLVGATKVAISSLLYYCGIVTAFRCLKRALRLGKVRFLCFHDVSQTASLRKEFSLFVDSSSFAWFVRLLSAWYRVVGVEEGVRLLEAVGALKDDVFVLTFDDGYRGWVNHVQPLCKSLEIDYGLFVTTGPLDHGIPLLYSSLLILAENTWRKVADLSPWGLGVFLLESQEEMHVFVETVDRRCRHKAGEERTKILRELAEYFDVPLLSEVFRAPLLCWDDLREMDRNGATVGVHSVTHPCYGEQNREVCDLEIRECKKRLEEELGHTVHYLAYPYGVCDPDMKDKTRIFSEMGFRNAFTLAPRYASTFKPFEISRRGVNRGMFEGSRGRPNKALLAVELSGFGDILFGRFLKRREEGGLDRYY